MVVDKTVSKPNITTVDDDQSPDVGDVPNGGNTNDNQLVLTISAESGSSVDIYDGAVKVGTATETNAGMFTYTTATLANGSSHSYTAVATDKAGNISSASNARVVNIVTSSLPPTSVTFSASSAYGANSGQVVGTFAAVDPDSSNFEYIISTTLVNGPSNAPLSPFVVSGNQLKQDLSLSASAVHVYEVTVRADDNDNPVITGNISAPEVYRITIGRTNADNPLTGIDSTTTDDVLFGLGGNDFMFGGTGSDQLLGQAGTDRLTGGAGSDILTGGSDADTFVFTTTSTTDVDTITDFNQGGADNVIDLTAIDANSQAAGDQAFAWGGTSATAFGVWYTSSANGVTVYADTDGNLSTQELAIVLDGITSLSGVNNVDFLL